MPVPDILLALDDQTHHTMAEDTSKISTGTYVLLVAGGAALGAALYGFLSPECELATDLRLIAYFDADDVSAMTRADEATALRFYLASSGSSALTVLAGPVKDDGTHAADASGDLNFQMFKSLSGSGADMDLLDESTAEDRAKRSGTATKPAWCVDATFEVVREMLGLSGCNGIGIMERATTDGGWTFDLVPVTISGDEATAVGSVAEMAVGAPCPNFCGRDVSAYLHMR